MRKIASGVALVVSVIGILVIVSSLTAVQTAVAATEDVTRIAIRIGAYDARTEAGVSAYQIDDRAAISAILSPLRSAKPAKNHACIMPISIEIRKRGLSLQKLTIKSAHKSGKLNFVLADQCYEFDAAPFIAALDDAEIDAAKEWLGDGT